MSVANLAYSFSYSTGSWFYTHGLEYRVVRAIQSRLFGIPAHADDLMAMKMLILIGATAYLLSFLAVHVLPDQRETLSSGDWADCMPSPDRYRDLGERDLKTVNLMAGVLMAVILGLLVFSAKMDPIRSVLVSFFMVTFLRKLFLDERHRNHLR